LTIMASAEVYSADGRRVVQAADLDNRTASWPPVPTSCIFAANDKPCLSAKCWADPPNRFVATLCQCGCQGPATSAHPVPPTSGWNAGLNKQLGNLLSLLWLGNRWQHRVGADPTFEASMQRARVLVAARSDFSAAWGARL